jgi:hypothetical protein
MFAFPQDDRFWREAADALMHVAGPNDLYLAPAEFMHIHKGVVAMHVRKRMLRSTPVRHFVMHKGRLALVDQEFLSDAARLRPVFANEVFVVYSTNGAELPDEQRKHLGPFLDYVDALPPRPTGAGRTGIVITTHDRPWALERTLANAALRDHEVVVVDDGSAPAQRARNAELCEQAGALCITYLVNHGVAHALNVGVCHLLAEADIEWISTFNDDVEIRADAFDVLARVIPASPFRLADILCTGCTDPQHPEHGTIDCDGIAVRLARSATSRHLHAHRGYWEAILPIPTAYLGAPKSTGGLFPGHGSDSDFWINSWAPNSSLKRCGALLVVPGLVTSFAKGAVQSSWANPDT